MWTRNRLDLQTGYRISTGYACPEISPIVAYNHGMPQPSYILKVAHMNDRSHMAYGMVG